MTDKLSEESSATAEESTNKRDDESTEPQQEPLQNGDAKPDCNGKDTSHTNDKHTSISQNKPNKTQNKGELPPDDSSANLSIHRYSSKSLESEDSFHQAPQTVISPHNPIIHKDPSQKNIPGKKFSVTRVQTGTGIGRPPSGVFVTKLDSSRVVFGLGGDDDAEAEGNQGLDDIKPCAPLINNDNEVYKAYRRGESLEMRDEGSLGDFDYIMNDTDGAERTYRSEYSVNTQDSSIFRYAPLKCGNIGFVRETSDVHEPKKHYVCISGDTQMDTVSSFMNTYWGLKSPKIVLSVISDAENFKPWKRQQLKDDFQKGIVKAANATAMWIVTDGIDAGVTKIIGDAVREYNMEHIHLVNQLVSTGVELKKRRLPILGIVRKDMVPYSSYFNGTEGVQVKNYGNTLETSMYELNPDHSHFLIVDEMSKDVPQDTLRCMIERQFGVKYGHKRMKRLMSVSSENGEQHFVSEDHSECRIPVVGLLVQGTTNNIEHVMYYLQNKMPVIILKGSGGLSDMIAFVFEELVTKGEGDPDFEQNFLKPELIKMINRMFPTYFEDNELDKLAVRDRIIQAMKMANEGVDSDHSYISIVNMKGLGSNMRDLDKFILRALFKTMKPETMDVKDQMQNDLQLTIDWNRPDLAWEIFQHDLVRVRIDKKMFEQCLIQKEREEFIDLFLSQGVKVHSYLNPRKLKYLFERADDRELFMNVCIEGILGLSVTSKEPLGSNFMTESLNRLIYKLSKIKGFTQPKDLYMSSVGFRLDSVTAERKAINYLIIWAVLMNRHTLAKTLWNRCDEPIGVALICSRMYKEMSKYCKERYRRTELEENAKEFGEMALGALNICWRDSTIQAYNMLGKQLPDFNDKTVIEIAHDAGYIHFLAHPCCQRWLTKKFHGQMQIKELDWGFFRLPYWFKDIYSQILSSVFLIFPMFFWIAFKPERKVGQHMYDDEEYNYNDDDSEASEDPDQNALSGKALKDPAWKRRKEAIRRKLKSVLPFKGDDENISFCQKIYLLWTAPISKFWITQVFYFAYLGLFCLATLWPVCGNYRIDMILWVWTAIILLELICRVYVKYHKYKNISLLGNYLDIFLIAIFLVLLFFTRILFLWFSFTNYIQGKTIMCFGLIYFFYRLLGKYKNISLLGNYLDKFLIATFLVLLFFTRILFLWFSFTNYIQGKTIMCFGLIYFFYRLLGKYKNISLLGNYLDIFLIATFLVLLFFTRILFLWFSFTNYTQGKTIMCFGLIYFFYRLLGVYLPISPTLGPMLLRINRMGRHIKTIMCFGLIYFFYRLLGVYLPISPTLGPMLLRINRMVSHDFVTFIRMFLIFMIAGGVTIQAVIYPHWPLNIDMVKRIITRPIYAMFLTQVSDLDGDLNCNQKYRRLSGYCASGVDFYDRSLNQSRADYLANDLQQCPYSSFAAYVITIQYLLICKLVLVTLLFAMFSLTIQKVDKEASVIWKYQRYSLIMDFKERFTLPPPFTILCFIYYVLKFVYDKLRSCRKTCASCCDADDEKRYMTATPTRIEDAAFWKRVAREYVANESSKLEKDNVLGKHGEILMSIQEDLRSNRKTIKRLGDKVVELERMIQSSRLYLEDVQHKLEKTDVQGITNVKGNFIHIAARQSPYPGTSIARFPVFDKYVPWEVIYDVYDPKTYTLNQTKFPTDEIQYVDEDMIELNRQKEERMLITNEEEMKRLPVIPEFDPKWNTVITYRENGERKQIDRRSWINKDGQPLRYSLDVLNIPHYKDFVEKRWYEENGERKQIDRRSWINKDGQPLRYSLDVLNIPQNPLGRTGIRGKGSLWRWGPNHVIKAVVTRYRRKQMPDSNNAMGYLYVEGKRVLEFISIYIDAVMDSGFGLPGSVLLGTRHQYNMLCQNFVTNVLNEPRLADQIQNFNQAEMIQFFSQFATSTSPVLQQNSPAVLPEVDLPSEINPNFQLQQSESKSNLMLETDEQGFSASLIYKGYLDDPRNTDNAWVEAEVWNFHYDLNDTFDLSIKEDSAVKWKEVSPYVKMFGNECVIVQEAARIHDAYH